jgi:serine/threonine protein phosphatase 1
MKKTWIIGDIHGCCKTFRFMVEEVLQIQPGDALYLLGDLIDRGPDSKGVVDLVWELTEKGIECQAVMGNHELMLLRAHRTPEDYGLWMYNDGRATLHSFGIPDEEIDGPEILSKIPRKYLDFFARMPFYLDTDDAFLVHAGLNGSIPDPLKDTDAMLWSRKEYYPEKLLEGKPLVHGHTPNAIKSVLKQQGDIRGKIINLDAGCVYAQYPGYNHLAALNPVTGDIRATKNRD